MVDADEARRIAEGQYAWHLPNGEPAPTSVTEFDVGYLVMPVMPSPPPPPPDQPPVPTNPGKSVVVVDKDTGATSELPYLGDEGTADLYRRERHGWWH
jgi:hypothetical protein